LTGRRSKGAARPRRRLLKEDGSTPLTDADGKYSEQAYKMAWRD
jgi:hypothetical protein